MNITATTLWRRLAAWRGRVGRDPNSINRRLFQLAWPSLIENILQTMLGVVDLIFVGQLGADAIAGVGLGNQVMFTLVVAFIGLAVGNTALVARAMGAGEPREAERIAKQSLVMSVVLSVFIAALGLVVGGPTVQLMGAAPGVSELATQFIQVTTLFSVFIAVMLIGSGTLRGAGDTRTPMLITAIINFINIVLDYGLIFGNLGLPQMGAIGSAYATTTARGVGALLVVYVLFRRNRALPLRLHGDWRPNVPVLKRILNIGMPAAGENIIFQLGLLVYTGVIVGLGTADLAAMQVAFNIMGFSILPALAFGIAALTLVGQNLGGGDISRAEATAMQALKSGMVWMSLMGAIFIIWRRELFGLYTQDPEVIRLGDMIMVMIALLQPLQAIAIILSNALRSAGDTRATMVITAFTTWGLRVGVGYLLGIVLGLGLFGVWLGWCTDFVVRAALITLRWRVGYWKYLRV